MFKKPAIPWKRSGSESSSSVPQTPKMPEAPDADTGEVAPSFNNLALDSEDQFAVTADEAQLITDNDLTEEFPCEIP
jgi:hypothetical protein